MKVLQISCGFSYSSVYKNLFDELLKQNVNFEVYIPQHNNGSVPVIEGTEYPYIIYCNKIIWEIDRVLYFSKIFRMKKDVETNFNLSKITLIHAHSLFSDGGVAYELYKQYSIPYIVAVRNTDVNKYFKYGIHLKGYALKILRNASKIIFISKSYRELVIQKYIPVSLRNYIYEKSEIIPNGIDKYWHQNIESKSKKEEKIDCLSKNKIRIIYVGTINKNKNIKTSIKAIRNLQQKSYDVIFTVVGRIDDESFYDDIKMFSFINYIEPQNKTKLIHLYRSNQIFLMPSIRETFGLVYVEAMTQGLPVIYTKGQGFDGQFNEGVVGYSVFATDEEDISNKILLIKEKYSYISDSCIDNVRKFNWEIIANKYVEIYKIFSIEG